MSYDGHFGFIGLYIVVPEWRGQGMGWRLWTQAMQRLAGHLVGLDGVGFTAAWDVTKTK